MPTHDDPDPGAGSSHGHDQDHFDSRARDWDDESKVHRARVVADAVRAHVPVGPTTRLLEYGAGTGLTTQFLAGDGLARVVLAEPSAGMREVLAEKVADGRLPVGAEVVDLDLSTESAPDDRFDLVVTVQTLHHIPDVDAVLAGFADLLEPGGNLCIVDLEAEDGSFHAHLEDFHGHDGFRHEDLASRLATTGLHDESWEHVVDVDKDGRSYPLFLSVSTRR